MPLGSKKKLKVLVLFTPGVTSNAPLINLNSFCLVNVLRFVVHQAEGHWDFIRKLKGFRNKIGRYIMTKASYECIKRWRDANPERLKLQKQKDYLRSSAKKLRDWNKITRILGRIELN